MKILVVTILLCMLLAAGCTPGTAEGTNATMETQIETVRTDEFSMDYVRFGHGGKNLVILPGLSVESVMNYAGAVAEAYAPLTEDFTVWLFERRKELSAAYSVYDMAEDTAAAFRALGLRQVSLFGASQGGMIAMILAAEHPELVSRLVLGSTSACMEPAQYQTVEKWVSLAKAGNASELYLTFGEAIYPEAVFEQSRDLLAAAAENVTEEDLRRFVILAEGMKDFDVRDKLKKIACPVLVLGSVDDRVLGGEASRRIAELLQTDTTLYMYDGYGHAAYDTAPDYKSRMADFLLNDPAE